MEGDDEGLIPVNKNLGNGFYLGARGTPQGVQTTNDADIARNSTCLIHATKVYRPFLRGTINPKQL